MDIQSYLKNYNKVLSNIEIKQSRLDTLKLLLENWDGSCESLKGQVLSDMPFVSGEFNSKTEMALIKKEDLKQRITDMQVELKFRQEVINTVNSKLKNLNEEEKFIIECVYINNIKTYNRVSTLFKAKFDVWMNPKSIIRSEKNAIRKMQ